MSLRFLAGLLIALALGVCSATTAAAAEPPIACLRTAAPGTLALLTQTTAVEAEAQLFDAGSDGARQVAGTRLGALFGCPDVAGTGDTTAIAGLTLDFNGVSGRIRAAIRTGNGEFGEPVDLDTFNADDRLSLDPHVAVGPRGDVAVIWYSFSFDPAADGEASIAVRIARRPAGGQFGPAETLSTIPASSQVDGAPVVAVGIDGDGTTTALWSDPLPDQNGSDDAVVRTAAAPSGGGFSAVRRISGRVQTLSGLALAVAPSGRAVAAWTGTAGVSSVERSDASSDFTAPQEIVSSADPGLGGTEFTGAAAALGSDGTTLVSWVTFADQTRLGMDAAWHTPGAGFAAPQHVWSETVPGPSEPGFEGVPQGTFTRVGATRSLKALRTTQFGASEPDDPFPIDLPRDEVPPRALVSPDGRLTLTWLLPRPLGSDEMPTAWTASGTTGAGFGAAHRVSGDCRPAAGITPFTSGSDPLVSWIDNSTTYAGDSIETPASDGRLHIQTPDQTLPSVVPPIKLAAIAAPPSQAVYFDDPVTLDASCDRACDLRAWVPGGRGTGPVATAGATLTRSGRVQIGLVGPNQTSLAPRRPGRLTIRVRACDPSGNVVANTSVSVHLARRRIPPFAQVSHLRGRRAGKHVVATWRTDRPAKRQDFVVLVSDKPHPGFEDAIDSPSVAFVAGAGKRSFKALVPNESSARYVAVIAVGEDPPNHTRVVSARIHG